MPRPKPILAQVRARQKKIAEREGDPAEVFKMVWRRRWILLTCVVLIPLAAYLGSSQLEKSYESSTLFQVPVIEDATQTPTASTPESRGNALVARQAELSEVADAAARLLGLPDGSLRGRIKAEADEETGMVTLTAAATTAKGAAATATAATKALNAIRKRRALQRAEANLRRSVREFRAVRGRDSRTAVERVELRERIRYLRALRTTVRDGDLVVVEPAAVPATPVSPQPRRNAILALVAAILVGFVLVVVLERMDRRVRSPEQLEELAEVPLLAVVPAEAFPGGRPARRHAFAFQALRDGLTYFNVDDPLTTIAVVSPLKGEGKTTVATNLAVSYARANKRVILVDGDLRKPQVARRLGIEEEPGLTGVLLGVEVERGLREVAPFGAGLRVLPAGPKPPNPSELIGSKRMSALLGELTELADVVVIDTTPLVVVSDAFPLLQQVSGTVGIARLGQTPRDAVKRMVEITKSAGGRVLGMVATGAKGGTLRDYGYGYGYEAETPAVDAREPVADDVKAYG